MEIAQTLLPNSPLLRLENWQIDLMAAQIILTVVSTQELACCPLCHQVSDRIHSHYERNERRSSLGRIPGVLGITSKKVFL